MQKYRSKYHVQKVQPVRGKARGFQPPQISLYTTPKNPKASTIKKKSSHFLQRQEQPSEQLISQEHGSQNITKATKADKIHMNRQSHRTGHREQAKPPRPASQKKGKMLEVAQRGKSLKYWKIEEDNENKIIARLKNFFCKLVNMTEQKCNCQGECIWGHRWLNWVDVPIDLIRKQYQKMLTSVSSEPDLTKSSFAEREKLKQHIEKFSVQIKKDVHRTQGDHEYFRSPVLQQQQFNILLCYAVEDREIGYIQGMNMILSGVIYHVSDEALCYGIIRNLFFNIRNIYLDNFKKCYEHVEQLESLIKNNVYDLYEHLMELNVQLKVVCFPWMLSLMSVVVPIDYLAPVFDAFMREGWPFMYRMGLAIFLYHKQTLKEIDECGDVLVFLSATHEKKSQNDWPNIIRYAHQLKRLI